MKFKLSTVAALFMVAVVTAGWVAFHTDDHAPDVTFKTLSGEQITTRDLRGRPLLVSFWASNCVSCLREMPHLVELHHELNARGFQIVGVAMDYDPPNRVVETAARFKIPYRVSLDLDGQIAEAFDDVRFTPTNYLIDAAGRVVFRHTGLMDIARLRDDIIALLPANES